MFQLKSLFSKVPLPENNTDNNNLPPVVVSSLTKAVQNLPVVSEQIKELQSSLEQALNAWEEDKDAANELVILSSPVEPLSKIIRETFKNWQPPEGWNVKLLSRSTRPDNCLNISQILKTDLGIEPEPNQNSTSDPAYLKQLIVIPSLELYFLRQIYGLDAIEYLRELIFKDTSHFWLIGCNNLAWEYLDYVYKISAYFEKTINLPTLESPALQKWLMPVLANANLNLNWDGESTEEREGKLKSYFDRLTDTAGGSLAVAAELWWRSLRLPETEETSEKTENPVNNTVVKLEKIKLPELPQDLTAEDRYLLFSLLLHQQMTLQHLALSLGDSESTIQFELQKLLTTGIIKRDRLSFCINPAYYPRLKIYLKHNNFITGI